MSENKRRSKRKIESEDKPLITAFSYSRIYLYEQCPLRYKYKNIDKIPESKNILLDIGLAIHMIIERYFQHCINKGIQSQIEVLDEIIKKVIGYYRFTREEEESVKEITENYLSGTEVPLDNVFGVEERFAINKNFVECTQKAKDVFFRCKIDLLQIKDNIAEITDYKGGQKISSDKFQLECYAWILSKIFPQIDVFATKIEYVRFGKEEGPYLIEKDDIPEIEERILRKCEKMMKEKKFKPSINNNCDYCGYRNRCPAIQSHDIDTDIPTTDHEAKKIAKKYLALNLNLKDMKEKLKNYVDLKGELKVSGYKFYYKPSESYKNIELEKLITKCDDIGIDLKQYLALDMKKAKNMLEQAGFIKLLKEHSKIKVSSKFSIKKDDEEKETR